MTRIYWFILYSWRIMIHIIRIIKISIRKLLIIVCTTMRRIRLVLKTKSIFYVHTHSIISSRYLNRWKLIFLPRLKWTKGRMWILWKRNFFFHRIIWNRPILSKWNRFPTNDDTDHFHKRVKKDHPQVMSNYFEMMVFGFLDLTQRNTKLTTIISKRIIIIMELHNYKQLFTMILR